MIRQQLFTGWNFLRWIRLAFGILLTVQTIQTHDTLSGFFAAFFLFQAFTNTGCCGVNGCALPEKKSEMHALPLLDEKEKPKHE